MQNNKHCSIGAFFDVDGTIVNINTMSSFHWYYYLHRQKEFHMALAGYLEKIKDMVLALLMFFLYILYAMKKDDRLTINRKYYAGLKGINKEDYEWLVAQWFSSKLTHSSFNHKVVELLKEHQAQHHMVILVSGSHGPLIRPIGIEHNVDYIIATEVETSGRHFTGKILNDEPLVGSGKANAIKAFAEKYSIDLSKSYAYSDHISDIHMLEIVGNPFAVIGDKQLMQYAQHAHGWNIIKL